MNRKTFLKNALFGAGAVAAAPVLACTNTKTPAEMVGPFPLKSPADFIRANVVGDRSGIALMVNLKIQTDNACRPLAGVNVDIWQCDAKGNYSEYDEQLDGDFTNQHFLRGRQMTDAEGRVSFLSIYPGWYPGRAPHIHVEILHPDGRSILVTQIAFPEDISNTVYATRDYNGTFDTNNREDIAFDDSLAENMADNVVGDVANGYVLDKVIVV